MGRPARFYLLLLLMNQAHIHLIVNHLPIMGSLFALLLLAAGMIGRNSTIIKAGLVSVLLAGLLCIPAQLTGQGAVLIVQDMPRVSRAMLNIHAEAGEKGFWVLEGAASLALFGLLLMKNTTLPRVRLAARLVAGLTLIVAMISFGLLARAGYLGGQIRHTEIREGFGTPDEL